MSPEAQQIAIAQACGWKWWTGRWGNPPKPEFRFLSPTGMYNDDWLVGLPAAHEDMLLPVMHEPDIPDYLNDLNAIADAVKYKIAENTDFSLLKYGDYMIKKHGTHGAITASAKQHCEAFLHTINKWTES